MLYTVDALLLPTVNQGARRPPLLHPLAVIFLLRRCRCRSVSQGDGPVAQAMVPAEAPLPPRRRRGPCSLLLQEEDRCRAFEGEPLRYKVIEQEAIHIPPFAVSLFWDSTPRREDN